jgi:chaperone required for assembly of F1-ATPase
VRRFYREAGVGDAAGGHAVELDGRPVKTPARRPLVLPTAAAAEAVAAEWAAQGDAVDPATMPLTRLASTAIDRVADNRERVIGEIAAYAGTDLLCHRAAAPADLVARQAQGWQPLLDWLAERHGARLAVADGIMAVAHPDEATAALTRAVAAFDDLALAALHTVTAASGSLVIALALADGRIDAAEAWRLSRMDEDFQIERWGEDAEAAEAAKGPRAEIEAAACFLLLSAGGANGTA